MAAEPQTCIIGFPAPRLTQKLIALCASICVRAVRGLRGNESRSAPRWGSTRFARPPLVKAFCHQSGLPDPPGTFGVWSSSAWKQTATGDFDSSSAFFCWRYPVAECGTVNPIFLAGDQVKNCSNAGALLQGLQVGYRRNLAPTGP